MLRFVLVASMIFFVAAASVSAHGEKDTTAAVLLGVIFPSGGQIYNEQYTKALMVWGGITVSALIYGSADNDEMQIVGFAGFAGVWLYSLFDAAMTADKINQRSRFGHLLEFDKEEIVLGVDPIVSRNSLGTTLSLRF